MKYCYLFFCVGWAMMMNLAAQTPVSGMVYGQWTLANSPYLVQNHLYILPGYPLDIEPGVEVVFQGNYFIQADGILHAVGTASQPILFYAEDTTNWHDKSQMAGGWEGIKFTNTSIPNDSSRLEYCHIKDIKTGFVIGNIYGNEGIKIERPIKMLHCKLSHSINKELINANSLKTILQPGQSVEIAYCEFFDNHVDAGILDMNGYWGGFEHIHHNVFHDNINCTGISGIDVTGLIEENEWYDNFDDTNVGHGPISLAAKRAVIRRNKFHHNHSQKKCAITCTAGKVEIDANLICNNQQTVGACGYDKGAGGIHVSHSMGGPTTTWDSTLYVIHNNVIANNNAYAMGGGMVVYDARVYIMNNHFINNHASFAGPAIYGFGPNNFLHIKNNLFKGNDSDAPNNPPNNLSYTQDIMLVGGIGLEYDYNWMERPFSQHVRIDTGVVFNGTVGDTTHNIISIDPYMIAPTPASGQSYDATLANFGLLAASTCINNGSPDTTNCYVTATDYAQNPRVITRIDIGAFEYKNFVGMEELQPQSLPFVAYPNPTQETLHLILPSIEGEISLWNLLGQKIFAQKVENKAFSLSLSSIPAGTYHLIWQTDHTSVRQMILRL